MFCFVTLKRNYILKIKVIKKKLNYVSSSNLFIIVIYLFVC